MSYSCSAESTSVCSVHFSVFRIPGATCRCDVFCAEHVFFCARSQLKRIVRALCVNGHTAKFSRPLHVRDRVSFEWVRSVPPALIPENISLSILFENEDIIAVNKAQGMIVHPGAGHWTGTLVQALSFYRVYRARFEDEFSRQFQKGFPDFFSTLRQGIVHRLDKDTSGVLLTSRNMHAHEALVRSFKKRQVRKVYLALLQGVPARGVGVIETTIVRDRRRRTRFVASEDFSKGKYARTRYKVMKICGACAFVQFLLDTGRTHQIRVHARYLGCPVVGDPLYGSRNICGIPTTLMLHAYAVRFVLPRTKKRITLVAPISLRFVRLIHRLSVR